MPSRPGGSGMFARNAPVAASCTAGGTGVMVAVLEVPVKRASGVRAETKKRGGPVAGRGAPVAMGSASEVAIGYGCLGAPVDRMGDGGGGDTEGWGAPASDTRPAAGSAHPAARTARAKPASAADVRDGIGRSSTGTARARQHKAGTSAPGATRRDSGQALRRGPGARARGSSGATRAGSA
ncbi:hypothetical protein GCM10020220_005500 [Nonomuraea rubra]